MNKHRLATLVLLCTTLAAGAARNDFDGDGRSDVGVYDPASGTWYIQGSFSGYFANQLGSAGAIPLTGDFDGDSNCDFAVYSPPTGMWLFDMSSSGESSTQFGFDGAVPVTGDFDGDGVCDFGVFDPNKGIWYLNESVAGGTQVHFGYEGTIPLTGDFDGDGLCDLAVYHPKDAMQYTTHSESDTIVPTNVPGTCIPMVGDYDGDGSDDIAYYSAPPGECYIVFAAGYAIQLGGMTPNGKFAISGDYSGTGRDDLGSFDAGSWALASNIDTGTLLFASTNFSFGFGGSIPIGTSMAVTNAAGRGPIFEPSIVSTVWTVVLDGIPTFVMLFGDTEWLLFNYEPGDYAAGRYLLRGQNVTAVGYSSVVGKVFIRAEWSMGDSNEQLIGIAYFKGSWHHFAAIAGTI